LFGRRVHLYITGIKLECFRNYESLGLDFIKEYNIIYGDNAQGKTNIIESIFLCASGRSHRTSKDADLMKTGTNGYKVKLDIIKEERPFTIDIVCGKDERKKIRINEIPVKKIGDLMGTLNAVIFSPEDLFIIKEGPSERRRFLDITLSQLKPSYFYDLQQYSKILFQRNMLLKEIVNKKDLIGTLDVWNHHLVKTGSRIMRVRKEFIEILNTKAEARHIKLTNNAEKLEINYTPSININKKYELLEIESEFEKALESALSRELHKCTTLYGPQRDDYDIILNGMSTKLYGSQGQQRTAVLSIKLSEIDIMKELTGEYPVLLLDDVLSELDNKRQEYLFKNIENIQTFITCTDRSFYNKSGIKTRFINVQNGVVNIK
jgi:DNA replication and repair protein RecF